MKKKSLIIIILLTSVLHTIAQERCINAENLRKLDALWEESLKETNLDFFKATVSEDFIWIHDHVSRTDSKTSLLELVKKNSTREPDYWTSRIQKDVKIIILGATGVVYGFTEIELFDGTKRNYNFMRTYAEKDGECFLIANHTMLIPEN